jgi:hypothetical protein
MRRTLISLLLFLSLTVSACSASQQEPNELSAPGDSTAPGAVTQETSESTSSADIFFYDLNECSSSDPDATTDAYCGPTYYSAICDVLEVEIDGEEGRMAVGNATIVVARTPAEWAPDTSLWTLAVYSQVDDMPSVYITLEEMPDNMFGYAFRPRLEWFDGTISELKMTGIGTPPHDADEPTVYNMEFVDQDGGQLYVSVTFEC